MSVWTSLKAAFKRPNPRNYWHDWPSLPEGMRPLAPYEALQLSAVWACVDVIASAIAAAPWKVYDVKANGEREWLPNDPLDTKLNLRPNDQITGMALRESLLFSALTGGNGYAYISRDGSNRVFALHPLEPDRVVYEVSDKTGEYHYVYRQEEGGEFEIKPADMFHLRGPSVNGLVGEGVVYKMARTLALARAAETYATAYFANGTVVGSVLEYPGKLDEKAYTRLAAEWKQRRQGEIKAHSALILEGGMKFQNITNDPTTSQLVESRRLEIENVARWFHVPLHKIGSLERATFSNIEHQSLEWVRDCLNPWKTRLDQEATWKLFPDRGMGRTKVVSLDLTALSQGDFKSRMEGYQIARRIGVYNVNDIRAREGDNAIGPDGDVRLVETNMTPLNLIEDRAEAEVEKMKEKPELKAVPPPAEEEDDSEAEDTAMVTNLATLALQAYFEGALDRHNNRLSTRVADLKRTLKNGELGAKVAAEKEKSREKFHGDLSGTMKSVLGIYPKETVDKALNVALESVEAGVSPDKAAAHLVACVTGGTQ